MGVLTGQPTLPYLPGKGGEKFHLAEITQRDVRSLAQELLYPVTECLGHIVGHEDACVGVDQKRSSRRPLITVALSGPPLTRIDALKAVRSGSGMRGRPGGRSRAATLPRRWITISSPLATRFSRPGRPARASRALTFFTETTSRAK